MGFNVALETFLSALQTLLDRAAELEIRREDAKPEESTKDKLLTPFLEALGYGPDERTLEASIRSLTLSRGWVDYLLLPRKRHMPWLMVEAKALWDGRIWETNREQVLGYLRNYAFDVGTDAPVSWLLLTNFREWHLLRLNDQTPFWSFSAEDLRDPDFAAEVYERLARENVDRNRLLAFYTERQRETLGEQFLYDLKTWRKILANGVRQEHPELSLEEIRRASHTILLRFLFIRLLENYGQETYYVLGRLYQSWGESFRSLPFVQTLQSKFRDTWASYNTELFAHDPFVDALEVPNEHLEMLVQLNPIPDTSLSGILEGRLLGHRSVYNYDFTTLTQDVLGVAYEQFLAHELVERGGVIQVLDNQETRKREGVFYTPEYIVQHIVRRVLEPQVEPHLAQALTQLEAGDFEAAFASAQAILNVRVIDPACGSGSFLLGAFEYLTDALERYNQVVSRLSETSRNGNAESVSMFDASSTPQVRLRRVEYPHERVLVGCIYGVDLDPQAVGLAKLSLWTQLLRAHPGQYGRRGTPHAQLPALTLNIRSGNSLIDAASPVPDALTVYADTLANAAQLARDAKNVDLAAKQRAELLQGLDETTTQLNRLLLPALLPFFADDETVREAIIFSGEPDDDVDDATVRAVREYLITGKKARTLKDFSEDTLREVLATLQADEAALEHARHKRPFNWAVEFPDIFDPALPAEQRGFTAVVGNPPYFNIDTLGRGALEYDWLRSNYSRVYDQTTDILYYFFDLGHRILRQDGELGFIVSRSFIQAQKASKLRKFLAQETTLTYLLDFLGHKVFKAGIATAILGFQKSLPTGSHDFDAHFVMDFEATKRSLTGSHALPDSSRITTVRQAELGTTYWEISPHLDVFNILDSGKQTLEEFTGVDIGKGMETGANEVFFLTDSLVESL